ncbi:MAG: PVC-type heme-binding CxxCH protein [Pirellulales bacterium]
MAVASAAIIAALLLAAASPAQQAAAVKDDDAKPAAKDDAAKKDAPKPQGVLPVGSDGKPLNLDFETGTLKDWTAEGDAFKDQPIKGEIDQNREFGDGKRARMQGEYWIGGYEKYKDPPTGTLTSASFKVTHPFAAFRVGGGSFRETRVELVLKQTGKPFLIVSGQNQEDMLPYVADLRNQKGREIFIRIVDQHTGGWGHVNFDDFRFYDSKPFFDTTGLPSKQDVYLHAGLPPDEAAKAMTLPKDFRAIAFAGEPDVHQPIAMSIDDRGRIWIAEAYEYPVRAPEGKGRDRILIFEDTDNDGKFDKRTIFYEGLNLVSGMEVGFGGVWVGAAPYLMFIPDKDGDDKPDAEPQVLLDGWAYQDTHETLNAFIWGPDGWLYGCHGVFTHSRVGKPGTPDKDRTPINAAVWRYHPTRHVFEVFAHGTSNPWGVDFDEYGNCFITACVIPHLYHMIQGGRYERQGGEHFNRYTYDDIKTIADHRHYVGGNPHAGNNRSDEAGGGHAHAGAMIYQGGIWPEEYRGKIFMNNIHGQRINMDILKPSGSGFIGSHGQDFLLSNDLWSQILNLRYGPDGNVYMIDWYDVNACHHGNVEGHDRSNGRIFKIVYEDGKDNPYARRLSGLPLAQIGDVDLANMVEEKNEWFVRTARRLLQERAAKRDIQANAINALVLIAAKHKDETRRLRALWSLHAIETSTQTRLGERTEVLTEEVLETALADASPAVRGWAIQLWADSRVSDGKEVHNTSRQLLAKAATAASKDSSPIVRRFGASMAMRLEGLGTHIIEELVKAEDADDHNLPLMYWYALEPIAAADPAKALEIAGNGKIPLLVNFTVRRIGAMNTPESLATLVDFLGKQGTPAEQLSVLSGINTALRGRRKVEAPESFADVYAKVARTKNDQVQSQLRQLAVTFGDARVQDAMRAMLSDKTVDVVIRRDALTSLVKAKDNQLLGVLIKLLDEDALRADAIRAMAGYDDPRVVVTLTSIYKRLNPADKRAALSTLSSRVSYAQVLMSNLAAKEIAATDITADLARQLRNFDDPAINKALDQYWGTVRDSDADRVKIIAGYKAMLEAKPPAEIDVTHGRAVFVKTCSQCHTLFGAGGKVGPELTGSNRANLEYILSNVLDPSAVMAKEYLPTLIRTVDGRQITGIIKTEDENSLTVQTAEEVLILSQEDVDERKLGDKSMMPDDLLKPLTEADVRALVTYLASSKQVPILANAENVKGLFNGKDLTGWVADEKLWSVEDGQIVGRTSGIKQNDWIKSEYVLSDFHFTCQVKLVDNAGNSGIQFRSEMLDDGEVKGYQADIGVGWWGKLYEEHGRALLWKESGEKFVKPGEWNTYEIIADGSHVQTKINGNVCVDMDDPAGARSGVIAFQLHAGGATDVYYKDISVTLIGAAAANANAEGKNAAAFPASKPLADGQKITWKKTVLDDKFRSEGVCAGDFNNDGKLDIAADNVWFEAPDWKMHPIAEKPETFDPKVYSHSFVNAADDINGDGWPDLIVVDFPGTPTWWFENSKKAGEPWKQHMIAPVTNNESPDYLDVDGDGVRDLLHAWLPGSFMGYARRPSDDPAGRWLLTPISTDKAPSTDKFSHGLGLGDVNGDGRKDVIVTAGWWEAPEDRAKTPWTFHKVDFGAACSQMIVYDFDGDGDNDVLSSSAHGFGIWWHEQNPVSFGGNGVGDIPDNGVKPRETEWATHEIDKSYSETHANVLADINGDGLPDFVTGKRWWSHAGGGPGGDQPAVLYWHELQRKDGKPVWTRHEIDPEQKSGVGTAFEVADVNADGLLDVVISNKHGSFYFEQVRE